MLGGESQEEALLMMRSSANSFSKGKKRVLTDKGRQLDGKQA